MNIHPFFFQVYPCWCVLIWIISVKCHMRFLWVGISHLLCPYSHRWKWRLFPAIEGYNNLAVTLGCPESSSSTESIWQSGTAGLRAHIPTSASSIFPVPTQPISKSRASLSTLGVLGLLFLANLIGAEGHHNTVWKHESLIANEFRCLLWSECLCSPQLHILKSSSPRRWC